MDDFGLADHAVGLELELSELVEQHERAVVQGLRNEASVLQRQIDAVQLELVDTAEELATHALHPEHAEVHGAHRASA